MFNVVFFGIYSRFKSDIAKNVKSCQYPLENS